MLPLPSFGKPTTRVMIAALLALLYVPGALAQTEDSIASRYGGVEPPPLAYDSLTVNYAGLLSPVTKSPLYVDLDQLRITRFTAKEGAPALPVALAQSNDGTLWIASQNGLVRFDGVTFDRSPGDLLPSPTLMSIFPGKGNDLWIGYTFGGVSRLNGNNVVNYPPDELPRGSVRQFSFDREGNLFAFSTTGVTRLVGNHWQTVTEAQGYTGTAPRWIGMYAGRFWIVDKSGAFRLEANDGRFERMGPEITESPEAPIPYRILGTRTYDYEAQEKLVDASGAVWVRTTEGTMRYRWLVDGASWRRTAPQHLATPDTKQVNKGMLVDREGGVWITGGWGLLQATATKFTPLAVDSAEQVMVMGLGTGNTLWFGGARPGYRVPGQPFTETPQLGRDVGCITQTADGTVWAVGDVGVRSMKGANVQAFPGEPGKEWGKSCQSIVPSTRYGVWLSIAKSGIFKLENGKWVAAGVGRGLPSGPAIRLFEDAQKRLWLTYPKNQVAMIDGDHTTLWSHEQGLDIGNVLSLYARGDVVWAAGDTGVSRLVNGRFFRLRGKGGVTFRACSGIIETEAGELWMNAGDGVYRVASEEIRRAQSDPRYEVDFEQFDARDGIGSPPPPLRPGPTLQQARDGTLWFLGESSLASIHPDRIRRNPIAPIVSIRSLVSEAGPRGADSPIDFPAHTRALAIAYTSAMLTSPDRVRFRYRLEGADGDWHDVGNRRTAYFTNLDPGSYRFVVEAFNEDGVPSRNSAVATFRILPAWYQTWWFKAFCALGMVAITLLLIRLQLKRSTDRVRLLLDERNAERERIARDLHDTLLQDFQGLSLHLQAWSASADISGALREQISRAADNAVASLKTGRDKIQLLREEPGPSESIEAAIDQCARQVIGDDPVVFELRLEGVTRPLTHAAQEEAMAIVRECIRNSMLHGRASRIVITIRFTRTALEITIGDNGEGASAKPSDESLSGHWGIIGMKERAQLIGARFAITFAATGVTARLRIASGRAFARRER